MNDWLGNRHAKAGLTSDRFWVMFEWLERPLVGLSGDTNYLNEENPNRLVVRRLRITKRLNFSRSASPDNRLWMRVVASAESQNCSAYCLNSISPVTRGRLYAKP